MSPAVVARDPSTGWPRAACIGPATAQTAQEHGLTVSVMSPEPNAGALIEALAAFGAQRAAEALAEGRRPVRPSETNPRRRRKT